MYGIDAPELKQLYDIDSHVTLFHKQFAKNNANSIFGPIQSHHQNGVNKNKALNHKKTYQGDGLPPVKLKILRKTFPV